MEASSKPATEAAEAARKAEGERQTVAALTPDPTLAPGATPPRDPARLAPAVAFASLKGLVPLPVSGALARAYGSPDGFGGAEKGVFLRTSASAVVAAPSDGWIAYAGPYRSFGQLLIINAGGGYYIVLAGMDRINVDLGQFVLAGEPIAVMGDGSVKTAATVALGAAQPILYIEFRKDGATIDPGPWWAKPELQKVRG
jgi:septal ring factor EnvC (AmiA/AmiB activator)